jgi:hypothetical protein
VFLPSLSVLSRSACRWGSSGFGCRPSGRGLGGFVVSVGFRRAALASGFAGLWSARLPCVCRGCVVRFSGGLWWVSVPVLPASVPFVVRSSGAPLVAVGSPPAVRAAVLAVGVWSVWPPAVPPAVFPPRPPAPPVRPPRRLLVAAVLAGAWPAASVPGGVLAALAGAGAVGVSGSRAVVPPAFAAVSAAVPGGVPVLVGCASGVDRAARARFASVAVVFRAARSCGAGAFAARSVSFVSSLAGRVRPVLLSFPSSACPAGLVPSASSSRCFCGLGSGSWASLAFAVGLGVPAFVWLPPSALPAPSWLVPLGGGWFRAGSAAVVQLSLF